MLRIIKRLSLFDGLQRSRLDRNILYLFSKTYRYRPFINIRKISEQNDNIDVKDSQLDEKIRQTNIEEQIKNFTKKQHRNSRISDNKSEQSRSKYFQQINQKINRSEKTHDLIFIFEKYNRTMTIQQHLNILSKIINLDNIKKNNVYAANLDNKLNSEKFHKKMITSVLDKIQYIFCRGGFKSVKGNFVMEQNSQQFQASLAPQYYIWLINILSKSKNIVIIDHAYRNIMLKILTQQLIKYDDDKYANKTNNNKFTICSVLTLQDNIKLLTSIFRLINNTQLQAIQPNKSSIQYQNDIKSLIKIGKTIIQYLHLPSTSSVISSQTLLQLIRLYIKVRPIFRINRNVIKSITKQQLRRIKTIPKSQKLNQAKLKQRRQKNEQDIKEQGQQQDTYYSPTSPIKKLLYLEQLIRLHVKQSTLLKQIQKTRQNIIIYHQFFIIQHKFMKFLKDQLLISLDKDRNTQHIDLLALLCDHIIYIYEEVPFQILSKVQITSLLNQQMEIIIKYLYLLKIKMQNSPIHQKLLKNWKILLITLCLRSNLRHKLPESIINNRLQQKLLTQIMQNFIEQPKDIQLILICYLLNNDKSCKLQTILNIFIAQQTLARQKKSDKLLQGILYLYGLMNHARYVEYLKNKQNFEIQKKLFRSSIKSFLLKIQQITNKDSVVFKIIQQQNPIYEAASIITQYLQKVNSQKQQQCLNIILSVYEEITVSNRGFSKHRIQQVSTHSKYLTTQQIQLDTDQSAIRLSILEKTSPFRKRSAKTQYQPNKMLQMYQISELISTKIDYMLKRISFLIELLIIIKKRMNIKVFDKYSPKFAQLWLMQISYLMYPKIYSINHLQYFAEIRRFCEINNFQTQYNERIYENQTEQVDNKVRRQHENVNKQYLNESSKKIKTLKQNKNIINKINEQLDKYKECKITYRQQQSDDPELYYILQSEQQRIGMIIRKSIQYKTETLTSLKQLIDEQYYNHKYSIERIIYCQAQ